MLMNGLCTKVAVISMAALIWSTQAKAATVTVYPLEGEERSVIVVEGILEEADIKAFRQAAFALDEAVVLLSGPGGEVNAAIQIGRAIRLKGFSTLVTDNDCLSACALIWLSGEDRYMSGSARIGFHAAYVETDGKAETTGVGNALVGAFVSTLGLNEEVIAFITSAGPNEFKWLTPSVAAQIGLEVSDIKDDDRTDEAMDRFNEAVEIAAKGNDQALEAVRLYWRSAQDGFAGAQNNLGDMYELGRGVAVSEPFAIYWYTRAAERGEPTAYYSLATILATGSPDKAQLVEALKFAILAVKELPGEKNRQGAMKEKAALEKRLTEKDIALAVELAASWRPLYQETNLMGDP